MKKSLRLMSLLLVLALLVLTGCKTSDGAKYKIIVPNGTPLLGMSSFLSETDKFEYEIVGGSDPLVAAFTKGEHDVIVAPVNLGAKMYTQKDKMVLLCVASRRQAIAVRNITKKIDSNIHLYTAPKASLRFNYHCVYGHPCG